MTAVAITEDGVTHRLGSIEATAWEPRFTLACGRGGDVWLDSEHDDGYTRTARCKRCWPEG